MEIPSAESAHIDRLVKFIEQRRMQPFVIFILEMVRPFAGSLSIVSEGFLPMLTLCFGPNLSASLHQVLADRQKLSQLITQLEESDQRRYCRGS